MKQVLLRNTIFVRSKRKMDDYALLAWLTRISKKTSEQPSIVVYRAKSVDINFMRELVQLSIYDDGPLRAQEFLHYHGIHLIIERHLPRTHLDGAAIFQKGKNPIIGLTLRYDRIDNFWFTLMHELAHISLHFDKDITFQFIDDLELDEQNDIREREADELAGEVLIPSGKWEQSPASIVPAVDAAIAFADELNIHPAIVAGRIRREHKAYRLLNNLVGHNEVRKYFLDVIWET
jgi:HTH-type transcriptional regulator/antitoxin HigA